ncbi:transcription factor NF-E2 45 kDa subunit isoform X1 [Eurytemora carolleeae]|uniref:transcription factor NF-E2 45 kDa subunit isoform X1 n=1 Tax=Eurytemora carolleeae TaxID=1294199 RepID=UPI000C75C72C|nr:transcription factor NF-E2 45 kDa subunit isoform X1 [Eurytemora carolleeae]|eukprot:XP_023346741.1 transcription factor NF-E2 45 kDa subunit-like isoform X1 [Eurytemora affinis]
MSKKVFKDKALQDQMKDDETKPPKPSTTPPTQRFRNSPPLSMSRNSPPQSPPRFRLGPDTDLLKVEDSGLVEVRRGSRGALISPTSNLSAGLLNTRISTNRRFPTAGRSQPDMFRCEARRPQEDGWRREGRASPPQFGPDRSAELLRFSLSEERRGSFLANSSQLPFHSSFPYHLPIPQFFLNNPGSLPLARNLSLLTGSAAACLPRQGSPPRSHSPPHTEARVQLNLRIKEEIKEEDQGDLDVETVSSHGEDDSNGSSERMDPESRLSTFAGIYSAGFQAAALFSAADSTISDFRERGPTRLDESSLGRDRSFSESRRIGNISKRDVQMAMDLGIPPEDIEKVVSMPMDELTDYCVRKGLSEEGTNKLKDVRRRGKNKVAAQNCRKRKIDQVEDLREQIAKKKKPLEEAIKKRDKHMENKKQMTKELDLILQVNKLYCKQCKENINIDNYATLGCIQDHVDQIKKIEID